MELDEADENSDELKRKNVRDLTTSSLSNKKLSDRLHLHFINKH